MAKFVGPVIFIVFQYAFHVRYAARFVQILSFMHKNADLIQ